MDRERNSQRAVHSRAEKCHGDPHIRRFSAKGKSCQIIPCRSFTLAYRAPRWKWQTLWRTLPSDAHKRSMDKISRRYNRKVQSLGPEIYILSLTTYILIPRNYSRFYSPRRMLLSSLVLAVVRLGISTSLIPECEGARDDWGTFFIKFFS